MGWKKIEPYNIDAIEAPIKLKQMTLRALTEGIITEDKAHELCPGCIEDIDRETAEDRKLSLSASQLIKLPKAERNKILQMAAEFATNDYKEGSALRDYDVLDEGDYYADTE